MSGVSGMKFFTIFFFLHSFGLNHVFTDAAKAYNVEIDESSAPSIFKGEWMIMFYAPWCPACQSLKPTWRSFAKQWSEDLSISVGSIDINKNPGLSGQFLVFQLPTIFHIKDGAVRLYSGSRSQDGFVNWVNDKSWRNIDSLEWWKNPNSIHMKAVGYFFRFANLIKDAHEALTETYNVPTLVVYGIFAIATILTGLILGMILVVVCDCINPPKAPQPTEDPRQYSKVEITNKTPVKNQQKKSRKSKAAPVPEPAAEPATGSVETDDSPPTETKEPPPSGEEIVNGKSADEAAETSAAGIRKRKPRKE